MTPIILASTSPYRRQLLERLQLPFTCLEPGFEERPIAGETPRQRVARFAEGKALAATGRLPAHLRSALVIGSDQLPLLDGVPLGKPGTHARAAEQLQRCSGREVEFLTAVCLLDTADGNALDTVIEPYTVRFRELSAAEIEHYLQVDRPYDCAGSFRAEALGVALFQGMAGRDPTALIGLPLIALCDLLRVHGVEPLLRAATPDHNL